MLITEMEHGQRVRVTTVFEGHVVVRNDGQRVIITPDHVFEPEPGTRLEVFGERNDWQVKVRTLALWVYRGGNWDWLTCKNDAQRQLWNKES